MKENKKEVLDSWIAFVYCKILQDKCKYLQRKVSQLLVFGAIQRKKIHLFA